MCWNSARAALCLCDVGALELQPYARRRGLALLVALGRNHREPLAVVGLVLGIKVLCRQAGIELQDRVVVRFVDAALVIPRGLLERHERLLADQVLEAATVVVRHEDLVGRYPIDAEAKPLSNTARKPLRPLLAIYLIRLLP